MSQAPKFSELFVFDLDGTLVHSLHENKRGIPDNLLKTVHEISKHAYVAVATGRRFKAAMVDMQFLPPMPYRIVHNGLVIKGPDEKTVMNASLPVEIASEIAELVESFGSPAFFVSDGHEHGIDYTFTAQTKAESPAARMIESRPFQKSNVISSWKAATKDVSYPVLEVATFGPYATIVDLAKILRERLPPSVREVLVKNVGHTADISVIEIFSKDQSKGHAVEWVRKQLGVSHVTAVGDDGNDLEMLEFADIGVVMDHAEDHVKAAGNLHVAGPEGLTKYLQEWLDR